jgi:hypothetical protein
MALFGGRSRPDLLRWLKRGDVRLLLPADPGPEQMLEYVRLFDPRATLAAHGSINVDSMREIYLSRGYPISQDLAAAAAIPDGMGVAYFVTKTTRAQPFSWSDVQRKDKEQVDASFRLVRGLAVRLGGLAHPHDQPAVAEPLRATVYTAREISASDVREIVGKFAPGLVPYDDPTFGPVGVSFWRTDDGQLELSHWPRGTVAVLLPHEPRAVGDLFFHTNESTAVRLELSSPGNETEPRTARILGECALEVAGAAGGPCVDQLGFRVTRPDDLVFG